MTQSYRLTFEYVRSGGETVRRDFGGILKQREAADALKTWVDLTLERGDAVLLACIAREDEHEVD